MGVLQLFNGLSLAVRLAIIAGVFAGAVGLFVSWRNSIFEAGRQDFKAAVARGDKEAVDGAWNLRQKLTDCENRGRGWDQTTGECR